MTWSRMRSCCRAVWSSPSPGATHSPTASPGPRPRPRPRMVSTTCAERGDRARHGGRDLRRRHVAALFQAVPPPCARVDLPHPRSQASGPGAEAAARTATRVYRRRRRQQRRDRGRERPHGASPTHRPRLPQPRELPPTLPPHRRRTHPMNPRSSPKSRQCGGRQALACLPLLRSLGVCL